MGKSRVLIIGATGNLGHQLAKASLQSSHPTFALVRDSAFSHPHKRQILQTLSDAGATLLEGSIEDESSLVEAMKQVDVVICAVSSKQVLDQKPVIKAIKRAGCIKVIFLCFLVILETLAEILGVFVKQSDIAAFTISAVDDPRTLNKVVYLRPPGNVYSMNELVELWESKIGKKLEKVYVTEEELLKKIKETPFPDNMDMVFIYSAFVKGDQTYFDIEASGGVDGTQLYPHQKYTTISEYLDTLLEEK
ncbi:probable pinoresinol-lariciresinol reductase 3 isoform X2 [Vitis riparia]|uniref:probable pinoresinol-lariciresinol reductase 3 isoform X2 n=1 Tax=Vitis riparia TaxID=96939 RepID=UPI00155A234D|nr:probable pinoresinol-lariciresinol reductase 3 isoform X2 [Vitis riparia]